MYLQCCAMKVLEMVGIVQVTWKSLIVLYYIVLYCIVLYCIVLYCIVLYCIVLYVLSTQIDIVPPYQIKPT